MTRALGQRLRNARGTTSLRELATVLGTDHAYLYRIEHGEKLPSAAMLRRICGALDVDNRPYLKLGAAMAGELWRKSAGEG